MKNELLYSIFKDIIRILSLSNKFPDQFVLLTLYLHPLCKAGYHICMPHNESPYYHLYKQEESFIFNLLSFPLHKTNIITFPNYPFVPPYE